MKVFLDERCLVAHGSNIAALLGTWREIADFVRISAPSVTIHLDQHATRKPQFLQRFNRLPVGMRQLLRPIAFGDGIVVNWRDFSISQGGTYQVFSELNAVEDCAVCEAYEHRQISPTSAIVGDEGSSYRDLEEITVTKIAPQGPPTQLACGRTLADFRRIGSEWRCLTLNYDPAGNRTPRDYETVLTREPRRFTRLTKIERNGRRHVYREEATGRLFYVDNLHDGKSAHLEVFDANENHLGIADLDGNLEAGTQVSGRTISW